MNNSLILSVIIPIYNGEQYIQQIYNSLKPIINNSKIEFIFINDGSTDNTQQKLNSIIKKHANIKICKIKNNNKYSPANARNFGMKLSNSKWVWFVDCDDELINHLEISKLVNLLPSIKYNIVHFKLIKKLPNGRIHRQSSRFNLKKPFVYKYSDHKNIPLDLYVCNKLYRKKLVEKFEFINTINEDDYFVSRLLKANESIYFYDKSLYCFNQFSNINSITNRLSNKYNPTIKNAINIAHTNDKNSSYWIMSMIILSNQIAWLNKDEYSYFTQNIKYAIKSNFYKWFYRHGLTKRIFYILIKWRMTKLMIPLIKQTKRYKLRNFKNIN